MTGTETLQTWRLLHSLRRERSLEEVSSLQTRLLRAAVVHAYTSVPFYQRIWTKHGVEPADIESLDDVARLPIVPPALVREAAVRGELLSHEARQAPWPVYYTSGSSGTPTPVVRGPTEQRLWRAFGLRIWLEHGLGWRDRTLRIDTAPGPSHLLQRAGILPTTWVSTALPVRERAARVLETAPAVVVGTPTSLRLLCEALEGARSAPGLRAVFSQGEVLDAGTARRVRSVLGVEPVSLYGLTELGYVAWQCAQRGGFHVNSERYVVEVMRDGRPAGPGELGALVVTDLRGRTMPHVRVDTGDLGYVFEECCPCGRTLPTISVEGRAADAIVLQGGRPVTARAVLDGLADAALPGDYRIHQEPLDRLRLTLRAGLEPAAVVSRLHSVVGPLDVEISPDLLGAPRHGGAEKTRVVSSAVPPSVGRGANGR